MYSKTHAVDTTYIQQTLFWSLVAFITLTAVLYLISIHHAVYNIVQKEKFDKQALSISLNVAELEAQYVTAKKTITLVRAGELGLYEMDASFIGIPGKKEGLSLNVHGE